MLVHTSTSLIEVAKAAQVHCVQAFGRLLAVLQALGPFPAGLLLHSWAGPPDMVPQLAAIDGVCFSVSGHITRLKPAKARATVAAVRSLCMHSRQHGPCNVLIGCLPQLVETAQSCLRGDVGNDMPACKYLSCLLGVQGWDSFVGQSPACLQRQT